MGGTGVQQGRGGGINGEIRPHVNPITLCFKVDESSEITPYLHFQNTTQQAIFLSLPSETARRDLSYVCVGVGES
jgi:hypothetical protein